jgi:hypothetical protein
MRTTTPLAIGTIVAVAVAGSLYLNPSPERRLRDQWALLDRYCVDCHNDIDQTGELSLEGRSAARVDMEADIWEKVVHKLRIGMMPPRDQPQPESENKADFLKSLIATLDAAAADEPYAATTTVHRLNRTEYANAIRDLFDVDIDVTALLPSDGGDHGFDNIADALTTSPMLLERYLTVALHVADQAIGDPEGPVAVTSYRIPVELTQDYHLPGLPLGTRGGVSVSHTFPADGEYIFSGKLLRAIEEGLYGIEGHEFPHQFFVMVDGEVVHTAEVGGRDLHELRLADGINAAEAVVEDLMTSPPVAVAAGPHEVVFTWRERPGIAQDVWEPPLRATVSAHTPAGMPRLEFGVIEGPYGVTGVSNTPSRAKIFSCRPSTASEEPVCAEEILLNLAYRAYRRPVGLEDIATPLQFFREARERGESFDSGIHAAVTRVLMSPWFLFRVEAESPDVPPGATHPVSDFELASRLSFFLWSSIPDEELLDLAEQRKLRDPGVLASQVRRMIADSRSDAFVESFTGQWLQLRNLDLKVKPDPLLFRDFDENLRRAFRRETELLFANVLRKHRPVQELLSADYSFVDERLARHYGIDDVYGSRFRRVEIDDPNRWGLLGHGSLLSLTSVSTRTSPIIRGKFILTEFWNNPPPAPPPDVPSLEESASPDIPTTVRAKLESHRENPTCAACHDIIDPVGFALENFDAIGQWRDRTVDGLAIDSVGILSDGTEVDGPAALRNALLQDPEIFAGTVTEKLMIYALGRGLEPADIPVVRSVIRDAADDDYALSSLIVGIVHSFPFQMRSNLPDGDGAASVAYFEE